MTMTDKRDLVILGGGLVGTGMPPPVQNFRPPPGFMNADGPAPQDPGMGTDEMLSRLRSLSGHWHQLAKLLPALQRAGIDGMGVEEETGLERKLQNVWSTSAQARAGVRCGAGCAVRAGRLKAF